MFGTTPLWLLVLAGAIFVTHLGLLAFTRSLRNYSRRRLEERCDARGLADMADDVAHHDEKTALAAEALFLALGLSLAIGLVDALTRLEYARRAEDFVLSSIVVMAAGYVLAGVFGTVFAEAIIESLWPVSGLIRSLAAPLTFGVRQLERLIAHLAGVEQASARPASVEVEVPAESEASSEDLEAELPEKARELLEHAVTLTRTDVSEIMTPRTEIVSLPSTVSAKDAARVFRETGKSRIPLYGENRDDVVGILYAKDLFPPMTDPAQSAKVVPAELVRPPFYVPESKNAFDLLEEFRAQRTQIAMILDEYGGLAGLITLEDLLEELVGVIDDEHDVPTPADSIRELGASRYEIDASMPVEDLNERLQLRLPTDDAYQTVAGLTLHALGRIPELGDSFRLGDVELTVAEVSERTIRRLILDLKRSENGPPEG